MSYSLWEVTCVARFYCLYMHGRCLAVLVVITSCLEIIRVAMIVTTTAAVAFASVAGTSGCVSVTISEAVVFPLRAFLDSASDDRNHLSLVSGGLQVSAAGVRRRGRTSTEAVQLAAPEKPCAAAGTEDSDKHTSL